MTRHIGIVCPQGAQALDISGPLDVFAEANRFTCASDQYCLTVIGIEPGPIRCSNGVLLQPHRYYADACDSFDLLLVAGGPSVPDQKFSDDFAQWLRLASDRARRFGSICNGAFVLARAGLLAGRNVTTHWNDAPALSESVSTPMFRRIGSTSATTSSIRRRASLPVSILRFICLPSITARTSRSMSLNGSLSLSNDPEVNRSSVRT